MYNVHYTKKKEKANVGDKSCLYTLLTVERFDVVFIISSGVGSNVIGLYIGMITH